MNYKPMQNYDIISRRSNCVTLQADESITILFKFLSYRKADPAMANYEDVEYVLKNKDEEYRSKYINKRTINVFVHPINKQDSLQDKLGFKLCVEPHMNAIDHIFRFYEKENTDTKLILPCLYHSTEPPRENKTSLYITHRGAIVEWLNQNEVSIQIRVPQVSKILKCNLLAYKDQYKSELLGNWVIEIYSLDGITVRSDLGKISSHTLVLKGDKQNRVVKLYSSHQFILWFDSPYDKEFTMEPGIAKSINMKVKSLSYKEQKIQINCVDIQSKELIYSWIIQLYTSNPTVSKMYDIKCEVNQDSIQKFYYSNRSTDSDIFKFESSDPSILRIIDEKLQLDKGGKEAVRVQINKRQQPSNCEVFVFISNQDQQIFDCVLFKIKYG
eukprot:TRINITY_DN15493_c0_g1_i1.p1 TRINITY_DN15493_c0_g1~~TRINITY_DN15493_c0_g1_i1.p1  ORF type:complete len:385 (+),score=63.64 TRINITY_DN15493_c0_g1_i1:1953-3107(+)